MPSSRGGSIILFTLLVALVLTLLPLPYWTVWMRPPWILLVLIYWTMTVPYRVNVGIAWFLGMILDFLNGTLLGEHALALTLVIYIVSRMDSRLNIFRCCAEYIALSFIRFD